MSSIGLVYRSDCSAPVQPPRGQTTAVCLRRLPALEKQDGEARGPRGPSGWGRQRGEGEGDSEDEGTVFTFVLCACPARLAGK